MAPTAAAADEPTPADIRAAADAFDKGREAYEANDYAGAAENFERADSRAPSATALEYAIRARDQAGQLDRAATLAALAQQRHPDEQALATVASGVLEKARQGLHELSVQCDEPCEVAVGGKLLHGGFSTTRTLFLSEGTHTIRAGFSNDRSDSEQVEASAGGRGEVSFEAPADETETTTTPTPEQEIPPEDPKPEVEESSGWSPTVFWVGLGLTAVSGGITVWSGLDTLNNPGEDRVREECAPGDTDCAIYKDGLASQLRTNVLIGVTSALGVGTILVGAFATDWSSGKPSNSEEMAAARRRKRGLASIEPWLTIDHGATLGARGRF